MDVYVAAAAALSQARSGVAELFAVAEDAAGRWREAQLNYGGEVLCGGTRPPVNLLEWPDGKQLRDAVAAYQNCLAAEADAYAGLAEAERGLVARPGFSHAPHPGPGHSG